MPLEPNINYEHVYEYSINNGTLIYDASTNKHIVTYLKDDIETILTEELVTELGNPEVIIPLLFTERSLNTAHYVMDISTLFQLTKGNILSDKIRIIDNQKL